MGFDANGVYTFYVEPSDQGYTLEECLRYEQELVRRIRQLPGVAQVTVSSKVPFGSTHRLDVFDPQRSADTLQVNISTVTEQLFDTLRIPITVGRVFTAGESFHSTEGQVPVVLSGSLARRLFGSSDPIGRIINTPAYLQTPSREHVVVGVAADARWSWVESNAPPVIYMPLASSAFDASRVFFFVRTAQSAGELGPALREAAAVLDASLPINEVLPMTAHMERWIAERRLLARLLTVLSIVGAVLAGVGLYALVAFSVAERAREFGIRVALGAEARRVIGLVLRQTGTLASVGIVCGIGGAVAFSKWLESRLYGLNPIEPGLYLGAVVCLVTVGFLAGLVPARTATRVDPVVTLRSE